MRVSIIPVLVFLVLLYGCESSGDISKLTDNSSVSQADSNNALVTKNVTTDTSIVIQGKRYKIVTNAYLDSSDAIEYYNYTYHDNKIDSSINHGYNGYYSISLVSVDLTDTLFTAHFDKKIFKNEIYGEILARANAVTPDFVAYLPEFNSLVFTLEIWVPESDWGQQALIMINTEGNITEAAWNNSYGGSGCDNKIIISKDGKIMASCGSIYNANKTIARLDSGKFERVLTELLSDSTFLVVYEQNDTTNRKNAIVLDKNFKSLNRFTYKGYYNILGFICPRFKSNNTLYLLNSDVPSLYAVHSNGNHEVIDLNKCEKLTGPIKVSEKKFNVYTEFGDFTFALDTIHHKIRWKTDKQY